jgi:hypothetical protein
LLGAGVVESHVEAPGRIDGIVKRRLRIFRTGDVTPDRERPFPGSLDHA